MKKLYLSLSILFMLWVISNNIFSQNNITVIPISSTAAAQLLLGNSSGVLISNITYSGHPLQLGHFTGAGSYIGINEGVIIATGDSRLAATTNRGSVSCVYTDAYLNDGTHLGIGHSFRAEVSLNTGFSDSDLDLLGGTPHNSAVLEFDFIPNSNSVSFEFIFASEEYEEWVNSQYNDVFGFFVSGGSISGPYSNNGINIAIVPNTNDPISINTVNENINSQHYIKNVCNLPNNPPGCPNGCCPCPEPDFQYDGFTNTMIASIDNLECNVTYHMRIGITNIADNKVGSAVFIKAGSFTNNFIVGEVTAMPDPVCEGEPLTLTAQGNSAYQYQWFDQFGQLVSTTQTVTFPAVVNAPPYTLQVTDPESGCNKAIQVNPIVHVLENQPPYTLGINKTGQYIYYVAAGQPFSFHINSFDALNENITAQLLNFPVEISYITTDYITPIYNKIHPIPIVFGEFDIPGEYPFSLYLKDDNTCGQLDTTENFKIVVLCPDCQGTVFYESRGLNTPVSPLLPPVTSVTGQIIAGYNVDPNQPNGNVVITPQAGTVAFYASEAIVLKPGFIVQPGANFIATIQPGCDDDCNDCCDEWQGFTITQSDIPNLLTPDGDGINEVWYVPDPNHSNCAFGIKGFELLIFNRWDKLVYKQTGKSENCCAFKAPGPQQPFLQYSSIFWNGTINQPSPGPMVTPGVYFYVLELQGCNNQSVTWSGFIHVAY